MESETSLSSIPNQTSQNFSQPTPRYVKQDASMSALLTILSSCTALGCYYAAQHYASSVSEHKSHLIRSWSWLCNHTIDGHTIDRATNQLSLSTATVVYGTVISLLGTLALGFNTFSWMQYASEKTGYTRSLLGQEPVNPLLEAEIGAVSAPETLSSKHSPKLLLFSTCMGVGTIAVGLYTVNNAIFNAPYQACENLTLFDENSSKGANKGFGLLVGSAFSGIFSLFTFVTAGMHFGNFVTYLGTKKPSSHWVRWISG